MRELRRAPRVPVTSMLVNLVQGSRLVRGDVSLFGIGFELTAPCHVKQGDALEVLLFLPDQVLRVRCIVRRVRRSQPEAIGRIFVGAELIEVDELVANPLYRFVEETSLVRRPMLPTSPL